MNTKHTPGPWTLRQHTDQVSTTIYGNGWSRPLAAVKGPSIEERDANARLIAAAPELLEACREAVRVCEVTEATFENRDGQDVATEMTVLVCKLREAIERATGRD